MEKTNHTLTHIYQQLMGLNIAKEFIHQLSESQRGLRSANASNTNHALLNKNGTTEFIINKKRNIQNFRMST